MTQLALQKILYMAHMVHLGRTGRPLVSGHFEAWDYGPVHPVLYQKVKAFGAKPIPDIFSRADAIPAEDREVLDEACDALLSRSAGDLVRETHWDEGAWAAHYSPSVRNVIIPTESIVAEYEKRMATPEQA